MLRWQSTDARSTEATMTAFYRCGLFELTRRALMLSGPSPVLRLLPMARLPCEGIRRL